MLGTSREWTPAVLRCSNMIIMGKGEATTLGLIITCQDAADRVNMRGVARIQ